MITGFAKEQKKRMLEEKGEKRKSFACAALFQFSVPSVSQSLLIGIILKMLNSLFSFHECESGLVQKDRMYSSLEFALHIHLFFHL